MRNRLRPIVIGLIVGLAAAMLVWSLGFQLRALWNGTLFFWPESDAPYPHFYIAVALAIAFIAASHKADPYERRITLSISAAASLAALAQVLLPHIPRPAGIAAYLIAYASQDFALFQVMRWAWICIRLDGETVGLAARRAAAIVTSVILASVILGVVGHRLASFHNVPGDDLQAMSRVRRQLSMAIVLDPADPGLRLNRARAASYLADYKSARADWTRLIRLSPSYENAYLGRGWEYQKLKDGDRALADYGRAIELVPTDPVAYYMRATALYELHRYDDSIADWNEGIDLGQGSPDSRAYVGRALAYSRIRDFTRALADVNEAIRLAPRSRAICSRGLIHLRADDYPSAIADFDLRLKDQPDDARAYWDRGVAFQALGDNDRALADFDETIDRGLKRPGLYDSRAYAQHEKGDDRKAFADYGEALKLDPRYKTAYINRGYLELLAGHHDSAIADFDRAIAIDPKDSYAYANRGSALYGKGQTAAAHADFETAISIDRAALRLKPDDARALSGLAWVLATSPDSTVRNGAEAVSLSTRACAIHNWKNRGIFDTLAAAYAETGKFDQAIAWQKKAFAAPPSDEMKERLDLYQHHQPYREK